MASSSLPQSKGCNLDNEKDDGYVNDSEVAPETTSKEEEPEWDRNSPEPSDASSSSSGEPSTGPGIKDRLQKLKERLRLSPDEKLEFQECIDCVAELEAQIHTKDSTESSLVEFLLNSEMETGDDLSTEKVMNNPKVPSRETETKEQSQEETSQPSSEEVRIAKEWSEESLKKIVPDIYHTYDSGKGQQLPGAAFLFLMVVEAISKLMCIGEPKYADCDIATHVRLFLLEFTDETSGIPNADVLAIVRNAIAHGNVYFVGNEMKMYNRSPKKMKCTKSHTWATVDDFISVSNSMCNLFLKWSKVSQYLPEKLKMPVEESK